MAGRDVAGAFVIQILNCSTDLNCDHVAGLSALEVDPYPIGLRREQSGTRGRQTRPRSLAVLRLASNPEAAALWRRPKLGPRRPLEQEGLRLPVRELLLGHTRPLCGLTTRMTKRPVAIVHCLEHQPTAALVHPMVKLPPVLGDAQPGIRTGRQSI